MDPYRPELPLSVSAQASIRTRNGGNSIELTPGYAQDEYTNQTTQLLWVRFVGREEVKLNKEEARQLAHLLLAFTEAMI